MEVKLFYDLLLKKTKIEIFVHRGFINNRY